MRKFLKLIFISPFQLTGRTGVKRKLTIINIVFTTLFLATFTYLFYTHHEPGPFSPISEAREYQEARHPKLKGKPLPKGYVSGITFRHLCKYLIDKRGGFTSNDIFFPTMLLDDMPNWEQGLLTQLRDFVDVMRRSTSMAASSGQDHPELSQALSQLSINRKAWVMPSAEGSYQDAVFNVEKFIDQLYSRSKGGQFYPRPDILDFWLDRVFNRLLTLSQDLIKTNYASHALSIEVENAHPDDALGDTDWAQWSQIDDVFYRTRGECWALYHLMIAINEDFKDIIVGSGSGTIMKQLIQELEYTIMPIKSPVILSGYKYGIFANHNLSLASYLSRTKVMIVEVRSNIMN